MINPYAKGSFTGEYLPQGETLGDELIVGHAYGQDADGGPGESNWAIGEYIDTFINFPKIVSRDIAPTLHSEPDAVMTGAATNTTGSEGIGTWGELLAAQQYMAVNGITRAILVGQRYHIGRIVRQAEALLAKPDSYQFEIVVPEGLPDTFDAQSKQWWTQRKGLWVAREALAAVKLKHDGQLL